MSRTISYSARIQELGRIHNATGEVEINGKETPQEAAYAAVAAEWGPQAEIKSIMTREVKVRGGRE